LAIERAASAAAALPHVQRDFVAKRDRLEGAIVVVQLLAGEAGAAFLMRGLIAPHIPDLRNACWASAAWASAGSDRALGDLFGGWTSAGFV
jgi:hypothetical protein